MPGTVENDAGDFGVVLVTETVGWGYLAPDFVRGVIIPHLAANYRVPCTDTVSPAASTRLIKSRRTIFQCAEVAVPGELFEDLLGHIRFKSGSLKAEMIPHQQIA